MADSPPETTVDIAIVGGGISGLYCALQLARRLEAKQSLLVGGAELPRRRDTPRIHVYETRDSFGGRIETWTVDVAPYRPVVTTVDCPYDEDVTPDRKRHFYRAEFGPMRIEPRDQPLLSNLLADLGISEPTTSEPSDEDLVKFPPYTAEEPTEARYHLVGEESEQHSLLDLLLLAVRRIFELINEDAIRNGRPLSWPNDAPARCWKQLTAVASIHKRYWKGELHDFIVSLGDEEYNTIRNDASINGVHLRNMGFWNLLSEVLSHLAVLKIRDWGSYYHLIAENPNAAEHLILWLRNIRSNESLRGIRGGMALIVHKLVSLLESEAYRDIVALHRHHTLISLNHLNRDGDQVQLHFSDGRTVVATEVILALPKRPLERLNLPVTVASHLGKVHDIPLLKVFFIIDQPWWEDNRPPNRFAGDLPTREVHYAKSEDKTRGMIMLYTDRPALQFWTDYLTDDQRSTPRECEHDDCRVETDELVTRQESAQLWILERNEHDRTSPKGINTRLWRRFVQYARDYEHNDFTMERLLACGIRDWGKEPYGAAVHVWKPRAKPLEVAEVFRAFPLAGSRRSNVHICGDAYSDYQGFIEGALRSTVRVLRCFDARHP
jgi:hypothetical protein